MKILGALLELPAKQHCQSSPFTSNLGQNWPNRQCCLAGSSKRAPRIFIYSNVLGAEYLSYVKSIATYAPTFLRYIISVLATVTPHVKVSLVKNMKILIYVHTSKESIPGKRDALNTKDRRLFKISVKHCLIRILISSCRNKSEAARYTVTRRE